ncbi:hypothetical protein L6452_28504 [Arctium lappa]|uniref:Uncharacterized protein n=1 Tax=Arctium lappa TaxID=4217 RepID=A0ACB8ZY15_ARCLA|nr:hypothetical protein L6452_28504 [Arctium lappa]
MLKVSSWKETIRFGKRGKLSPRFLGPFTILERIGLQAYRLDLPPEMDGIHLTFHVCYLRKCLGEEENVIPLTEIRVDNDNRCVEEPEAILESKTKQLRHKEVTMALEFMIKEKLDQIRIDTIIVEGGLKRALETFPNNEVFKKYKLEFKQLFKNKYEMTDELMVVAEEEEFLLSEKQELERNDDEGLEMTIVTTMMDAEFSQNPKTCGKDELIMKVYDPNEQEKEVMKEAYELGEEEKDKEETIEKDDEEVGEK